MHAVCPFIAATCRGVHPCLAVAVALAVPASSSRRHAAWPLLAARCRAVQPWPSAAATLAPAVSSACRLAASPAAAARCSAVLPSVWVAASMLAPAASSIVTRSACPPAAAQCKNVLPSSRASTSVGWPVRKRCSRSTCPLVAQSCRLTQNLSRFQLMLLLTCPTPRCALAAFHLRAVAGRQGVAGRQRAAGCQAQRWQPALGQATATQQWAWQQSRHSQPCLEGSAGHRTGLSGEYDAAAGAVQGCSSAGEVEQTGSVSRLGPGAADEHTQSPAETFPPGPLLLAHNSSCTLGLRLRPLSTPSQPS